MILIFHCLFVLCVVWGPCFHSLIWIFSLEWLFVYLLSLFNCMRGENLPSGYFTQCNTSWSMAGNMPKKQVVRHGWDVVFHVIYLFKKGERTLFSPETIYNNKTQGDPKQDYSSVQARVQRSTADAEPTVNQMLSIQPANCRQDWQDWDS